MSQQARPIVLQGQIVWRPGAPSSAISVQTWDEVEEAITKTEGFLTVYVDAPGGVAQIPGTADTECFGRVQFSVYPPVNTQGQPILEILNGGILRNPGQFLGIQVVAAPTVQIPILGTLDLQQITFREGSLLQLQAGALVPAVQLQGNGQQVAVYLGSRLVNDAAPTLAVVDCPTPGNTYIFGGLAQLGNQGPPQAPANAFQGPVGTTLVWVYDASVNPVAQPNFLGTVMELPADWAAGVAYDDTLVAPALGSSNVQGAIDALKVLATLPALANYLYVSPTGNDATANGSVQKPYATVEAAMASITTASPTSRWAIVVTGRVNDTLPIAFKANVFVVGYSPFQSRVTSPAWTLDASWTPAGDHRGGFINCTVNGALPIDFNTLASNEGKFYLTGAWVNSAFTFTRFSNINQLIADGARFFGALTLNGGQLVFRNNTLASLVTLNEGPASGSYQFESQGNSYQGDLTINYVSAVGATVELRAGDLVPSLTINGPINVRAANDAVSRPTLTGGASIRYTTPDTFACIYDDSGLSSGRVFTSYSNMMEYIAALTDGHVEVTLASDLNITSANDYSWSRITWLAQDVRAGATINFQGTGKIIGEPGSTDIVIDLGPGVTLDCNRATPLQDGVFNYHITVGNYGVLAVSGEAVAMFDLPDGQGADVFLGYGVDCSPTTLNRQGSSSTINVFAPAGTFNTNFITGVLTSAAGIFVAGRGYDAGWVAQQTAYNGNTYNRPAWLPFQCRETLDGNKNDYAPPYFREAENVFLDPDGVNRSISGFDATPNASYETAFSCVNKNVINPSATNTLTLQNQNAGSAVGNRIQTQTNADIVIPARGRAVLIYDEVLGGWRAYLSNT